MTGYDNMIGLPRKDYQTRVNKRYKLETPSMAHVDGRRDWPVLISYRTKISHSRYIVFMQASELGFAVRSCNIDLNALSFQG